MTDPLEDLLVRDLAAVADAQPGAHVDTSAVRRVARAERRRGRVVVLAAAAALVVAVTGVAATLREGAGGEVPVAAVDLPRGAALALPWTTADDVVHVDGRELSVPGLVVGIHRGRTTILATQARQGDALEWFRYRADAEDDPLVALGPVESAAGPVLSPDGRWVAWAEGASVRMLDVTTGEVAGIFVRTSTAGEVVVDSVDRAGRAVIVLPGDDGPRSLWVRGSDLVPLSGVPDDTASVHLVRGDLVAIDDHVSGTAPRLYRLSATGGVEVVGDLAGHAREPVFSPDQTAYVTAVGDDLAFARLRRDGSSSVGAPLAVPGGGTTWGLAGWENRDDVVLVRSAGSELELVRCSVSTDGCESVPSDGISSLLGYE